jgi:hypothetical protein
LETVADVVEQDASFADAGIADDYQLQQIVECLVLPCSHDFA